MAALQTSLEKFSALCPQGKRVPVKVFAVTEAEDKLRSVGGDSGTAAASDRSPGHEHSGSPASAGSEASPVTRSTLFSDGSSVLANMGTQPAPRRMQPMVGRQACAKASSEYPALHARWCI